MEIKDCVGGTGLFFGEEVIFSGDMGTICEGKNGDAVLVINGEPKEAFSEVMQDSIREKLGSVITVAMYGDDEFVLEDAVRYEIVWSLEAFLACDDGNYNDEKNPLSWVKYPWSQEGFVPESVEIKEDSEAVVVPTKDGHLVLIIDGEAVAFPEDLEYEVGAQFLAVTDGEASLMRIRN